MRVQASTELSRMLMLQRHSSDTRVALDRASQEMSTGLKSDKYEATGGNLTRLYSLERMLERITSHEHTIGRIETKLDMMQLSFQKVESSASSIGIDMVAAAGRMDLTSGRHHAEASRGAFLDLVSTLNLNVAGEHLFSGTATDTPAVRPAEEILAQIGSLVIGLSASDAVATVKNYFTGTGPSSFAADAYLGSTGDLAPTEVGDDVRVKYAIRATDARIGKALAGHALAALVATGGPFIDAAQADRLEILGAAGQTLVESREGLLELSARTGDAQAAVESARAQRNAQREIYELAHSKILAADPYESASTFEAMRSQLESVYTVTARLSALRFTDFIR